MLLWQIKAKHYMAPEILNTLANNDYSNNNASYIDEKKSDIFCFGVCILSAILLRPPFASG